MKDEREREWKMNERRNLEHHDGSNGGGLVLLANLLPRGVLV